MASGQVPLLLIPSSHTIQDVLYLLMKVAQLLTHVYIHIDLSRRAFHWHVTFGYHLPQFTSGQQPCCPCTHTQNDENCQNLKLLWDAHRLHLVSHCRIVKLVLTTNKLYSHNKN